MKSFIAYNYSCLMAVIEGDVADKILRFSSLIPDSALYDDGSGENGREDEPHITVKYGIHTSSEEEISFAISEEGSVTAKLGRMSIFENEEFNVLKLEVESPDLHRLNDEVTNNVECTNTYPVYHPHVTIAYLCKEFDYRKLMCDIFDGEEVSFSRLQFSPVDGEKTWVSLGSRHSSAANNVAKNWLSMVAR